MPPKKKAHQLAELMPPGEVLNSLQKSAWRLGPKLGEGGFGLIYLAHSEASKGEPMYVVKQEPVGNGPLAIECLFFAGLLKPDLVDSWSKKKNISNLGIPKFVAWGLHTFNTNKYRFLVMHRYGFDLQHHFLCGHFSRQTVGLLALRLIDALQFIHESKYVHADIKAANILTPYSQAKKVPASKTVYLVDYGLARKYINGKGVHETYTQDPRTAHDGTIEFTSRDAHMGVKPSRRGDMEILGYCLVQWLCGRLPWEDKLQDKNYVSAQKCKYMKDIPAFMAKCFPKEKPAEIAKYLKLVDDLEYSEEPDYAQYKELFKTFLRGQGISSDAPISFTSSSSTSSASSPARGKKAPPATANNNNNNNNNTKPVPRSKAKAATSSEVENGDSRSTAFPSKPPASRGRKRANAKDADEATVSLDACPAKSKPGAALSTPVRASPRTRKTDFSDVLSDSDDDVRTKPLRDVSNPAPSKAPSKAGAPSASAPKPSRLVKRKKNVATAAQTTQTSPVAKRARR